MTKVYDIKLSGEDRSEMDIIHGPTMLVAKSIAQLSKLPNKVGAVLTKNKRIVGSGCNGYPPGVELPEYNRSLVIHAEMNAILSCGFNISDIDCIYIYGLPPCTDCLKNMWNSIPFVYYSINPNISTADEWISKTKQALKGLGEQQ